MYYSNDRMFQDPTNIGCKRWAGQRENGVIRDQRKSNWRHGQEWLQFEFNG